MRCLYRGSGGLLGLVLVAVLLTGVGCKPEVEPPAPVDAGVDGGPGQSCDDPPPSCEALERNCGEVTDACGRTLQCGTCSAMQTCGGSIPGQCGGRACETDCPAGYTCAADGTCTGSPRTALALDLKVFEVEGQFVHDGVPFSEANGCLLPSGAGVYLDLKFTEVRSGAVYDANPECHASRGWRFKTWRNRSRVGGAQKSELFQWVRHHTYSGETRSELPRSKLVQPLGPACPPCATCGGGEGSTP